jgi:hypothetical protein
MHTRIEGRRAVRLTGALLAAAIAVGFGGEGLKAQSGRVRQAPRYRTVPARNLQAEAALAERIAVLNRLVAQERARQPVRRPRVYGPNEGPVNIPVNIPMYGPLTPAQRTMVETTVGQTIRQQSANCEARRSPSPYSNAAQGRIGDGWYDSMTGYRLQTCR